MERNLFDGTDLDSEFLQAVYDNDRETAETIFQQYLHDLPSDITSLDACFKSGNREQFMSMVHKKKVGFSYVGLTDITNRMSAVEAGCSGITDISVLRQEVESILERMRSSETSVQAMLNRLQQPETLWWSINPLL